MSWRAVASMAGSTSNQKRFSPSGWWCCGRSQAAGGGHRSWERRRRRHRAGVEALPGLAGEDDLQILAPAPGTTTSPMSSAGSTPPAMPPKTIALDIEAVERQLGRHGGVDHADPAEEQHHLLVGEAAGGELDAVGRPVRSTSVRASSALSSGGKAETTATRGSGSSRPSWAMAWCRPGAAMQAARSSLEDRGTAWNVFSRVRRRGVGGPSGSPLPRPGG